MRLTAHMVGIHAARSLALLALLAACAEKAPPLQNFCTLYSRTLPDAAEIAALKRPTKEAILGNERVYLRECTGRPAHGGQR